MCGIFGYCNLRLKKTLGNVCGILLTGLSKIDYRGYDSAGVCILNGDTTAIYCKAKGEVDCLRKKISQIGGFDEEKTGNYLSISHTRWATHGESSELNSHPIRSDPQDTFFLVHNGIIRDYQNHKNSLIAKGYEFETATDTEIAAKYCLYYYNQDPKISFIDLVRKVVAKCTGQYAFVFVSRVYPGQMVVVHNGAPVVLGIINPASSKFQRCGDTYRMAVGDETDVVVSSDPTAIIEHTATVVYLTDGDLAVISKDSIDVLSASPVVLVTLDMKNESVGKGLFEHFTLKEIHEQELRIAEAIKNRVDFATGRVEIEELRSHLDLINKATRFIFIACGTSYHSALAVQKIFEELAGVPVMVESASNFLDRTPLIMETDTVFFISQSGQTADTILAMNYCKMHGASTIGVTNNKDSGIATSVNTNIDLRAGNETGVASTKVYTSQFMCLILVALYVSQEKGRQEAMRREIINELQGLPGKIKECIDADIEPIVKDLSTKESILVIGRGYQTATCLEGALKIKEISYIHAEGIHAGELKHGSLALVTEDIGIIMVVPEDEFYLQSLNSFQQITARNGDPVVICTSERDFASRRLTRIPKTAGCLQGILSVIPLQMIAYRLSSSLGVNPDRPRNLAKSVTVE